jgi:hypothetical protein
MPREAAATASSGNEDTHPTAATVTAAATAAELIKTATMTKSIVHGETDATFPTCQFGVSGALKPLSYHHQTAVVVMLVKGILLLRPCTLYE